ncbi:MAG: hypothetical protein ACOY3P_07385 [Planctomycetota bacterium]
MQILRLHLLAACVLGCSMQPGTAELPPDSDWQANTILEDVQTVSDDRIGAGQGMSRRGEWLYVYGDVYIATPRVGIIRQYTLEVKPTGREIVLARGGQTVVQHPTGLTWDERFGCFLGDTVDGVANIYQIDWPRALREGNLDNAVLAHIRDDAAVNGCRPEFVTLKGRRLVATADYGDTTPEIRLYDPEEMLAAGRTSAPGVIVARLPCGPFNQNLHWDETRGRLTCIQNVVVGRGWRLDAIDLLTAVARGKVDGEVRFEQLVFNRHDELEGYCPLDEGRALFVTSGLPDNLITGRPLQVEPYPSPVGSSDLAPKEAVQDPPIPVGR